MYSGKSPRYRPVPNCFGDNYASSTPVTLATVSGFEPEIFRLKFGGVSISTILPYFYTQKHPRPFLHFTALSLGCYFLLLENPNHKKP